MRIPQITKMTDKEQDDQFVNTYMLTNDEDQSSIANNISCLTHIRIIPFIISVLIILIGITNMIAFYVIPNNKIKENKKKLPDAYFKSPNQVIIFLHFLYNSIVIICGISILLFSLRAFFIHRMTILVIFLIASCSLMFIFWVTYSTIAYISVEEADSVINSDELLYIVNKNSPIDFAFIYSKEMTKTSICSANPATGQIQCTDKYLYCYSKNGIVFPVVSKIENGLFNPLNYPSCFYFTIEQKTNFTSICENKFNDILDKIEDCSYEEKVVEYYPIMNQTWLVHFGEVPSSLSHKTRLLTSIFGVGVYYELYTKAIPFVSYEQKIKLDLRSNVNYDALWNSESCDFYGQCDPYNRQPVPIVNK